MKKIVSAIMAVTMIIASAIAFSGCKEEEDYLPEYENGYFVYAVRTNKDGTKDGYLVGLTEEGRKQKYLILPKELDGIKLQGTGYYRYTIFMGTGEPVCWVHSTNLKRFYVPFETDHWYNIERISCPNCYGVNWIENTAARVFRGQAIYGYNLLAKILDIDMPNNYNRLANVSYLYNYDNSPNGGYYWVDSYDNSTIEFIPPEPEREGYEFGGWYKEPECINEWNFETDSTNEEIVIAAHSKFEEYNKDDITELYAKWDIIN